MIDTNNIFNINSNPIIQPPFSLIYPQDNNVYTNILFIDNTVKDYQVFYTSVNSNTFPIVYSPTQSTKTEILNLIKNKFTSINKIAFCFTTSSNLSENATLFLDNQPFFSNVELQNNGYGNGIGIGNVEFLINLIRDFNIKNFDFLACNTLQYSNWVNYFKILSTNTNVIVGASNDKTGNIKYGGDWIMENTKQNIEFIYFTKSIEFYKYLLDFTYNTITGDVCVRAMYSVIYGTKMYLSTGTTISVYTINIDDGTGTFFTQDYVTGLNTPQGLAVDTSGNLYIADTGANIIYKINTITSDSSNNNVTQNITILSSLVSSPYGLVIDSNNYLYTNNSSYIYKINLTNSIIDTSFNIPNMIQSCLTIDNSNNIYTCASNNNIVQIKNDNTINLTFINILTYENTQPKCIYFNNNTIYFSGNNGRNSFSSFSIINGIFDNNTGYTSGLYYYGYRLGNLYANSMIIYNNNVFININTNSECGIINYTVSNTLITPSWGTSTCFTTGMVSDASGNIYISNGYCNTISQIPYGGSINKTWSTSFNNHNLILGPTGLCIDDNNNLYIVNGFSNTIIKINLSTPLSLGFVSFYNVSPSELTFPSSILYYNNYLYVSNSMGNDESGGVNKNSISKLYINSSDGTYDPSNSALQWYNDATLSFPVGICMDNSNNMYILWTTSGKVAKLHMSGINGNYDTSNNIWFYSNSPLMTGCIDNTNTYMYISAVSGSIYQINLSDNTYVSNTTSGISPWKIFLNNANNLMYIANNNNSYDSIVTTNPFASPFLPIPISGPTGSTGSSGSTGSNVPCFLHNSKILTRKGYIPIQDLRNGDLVKTSLNGFKPIFMIGKRDINHPCSKERIKTQLYKCTEEKYPALFEDLIITGCHCILVDEFSNDEQREKAKEVHKGRTFVTDEKYRLPACADENASVYEVPGDYTIYHLALEHDDYFMNYGIYANGLLVESCSKRYLKEKSNMILIE